MPPMELLFLFYASVYSSDASWTMSMQELFDYLQNEFLTDARFASFLTDDMRAQITGAQTMLTDAVTQLRGSDYSRLVLTTTLPGESDETSAFIAQLTQDLLHEVQHPSAGSLGDGCYLHRVREDEDDAADERKGKDDPPGDEPGRGAI